MGATAQAGGARRWRLAVVTETYPPEVNGVAGSLARLVQGLRQRGHDVQLVRPRQPAVDADSSRGDGTVLTRGLPIPGYPGLRMGWSAPRSLVEVWAAARPDLVHIATEGPLGYLALRAARRLGLPVTSDFRTNFHSYSRHYGLGWLRRPIAAYLRHFHNAADATMVPTAALRDELQAAGFERLSVVGRGVDTVRFDPARRSEALRRQWGAAPGDVVVLYVGRLAREKNLDVLLQAFAAMARANAAARLVFVGDGPMRGALQARCPQAVFAGARQGEDLAACYASGDVFLFPSVTETFGNVTAEAMASGLAVLAFDHAAAGQLITPGRTGCLAAVDDVAGYVAQAAALACDLPGVRTLGRAARRAALALDWECVVDEMEAVFVAARWRRGLHDALGALRPPAAAGPGAVTRRSRSGETLRGWSPSDGPVPDDDPLPHRPGPA